MATNFQEVTKVPTALADIESDTEYSVQNTSTFSSTGSRYVYLAIAPTAVTGSVEPPAADTKKRFVIKVNDFGYPKADSGESIYIWTDSNKPGMVAYEVSD